MGAKDRHNALSPSALAGLTGVSTDTLRHYGRKGVLNTRRSRRAP
jgi:DNA-binding transcriptional MerR regulator